MYCMVEEQDMNLILAKALLKLQDDVKDIKDNTSSLSTIISNHLKFFEGIGDVGEQMSTTLQKIMDERDLSFKNTLAEFEKTQQFLKETKSQKFKNKNLLDESFLDIFVAIIHENTPEGVSTKDIEVYINESIRKFEFDKNINAHKTMNFQQRVDFHETMMKKAKIDLEFSDYGYFVARSIFIPYITMYHSKPLYTYPFLDDYMTQMKAYKELVKKD